MGESAPLPSQPERDIDPAAILGSLRERGADRFDPVRFRFIEALARRTGAYEGEPRRLLDGKLRQALIDYGERFEQAKGEAAKSLHRLAEQFPEAADDMRGIHDAGDFRGLRRLAAELESRHGRSALADLAGPMMPQAKAAGASAGGGAANAGPHAELKSLRYFRDSWSKLSIDQQLNQALAQGPENAGPLNSHRLVLQSLKLMRDIAPDYLNRFIPYIDALLWLDQANGAGMPTPKNAQRGDGDRKRKSAAGRSRSG